MDEKKEPITKGAPTKVTQSKVKAKQSVAKKGKSQKPASKLSIYVGNFPWVSITVCVSPSLLILMLLCDFADKSCCVVCLHCTTLAKTCKIWDPQLHTVFSSKSSFSLPLFQTCYNLKWVSDVDLIFMAHQLGVKDVIDVKFAESKVNGQSRG